jgi:hypothetical protein
LGLRTVAFSWITLMVEHLIQGVCLKYSVTLIRDIFSEYNQQHVDEIKSIFPMNDIISKQLKAFPRFKKQARIGYYEAIPLTQVHMDTAFWQTSGELNGKKVPILCIVDVATRFTCYFVQRSKNDSIKTFFADFIEAVKSKFPNVSSEILLITDGARELRINEDISGHTVRTKVSTGINKAVLAEVSIRKARAILRDFELKLNLRNIEEGTSYRINASNLQAVLDLVQTRVNEKAKIRKPKPPVPFQRPRYELGTPVFRHQPVQVFSPPTWRLYGQTRLYAEFLLRTIQNFTHNPHQGCLQVQYLQLH